MTQDKDPVGRLFARLTGQLEDATALASEGQDPMRTLSDRRHLGGRIHRLLGQAAGTLASIDRATSETKAPNQ